MSKPVDRKGTGAAPEPATGGAVAGVSALNAPAPLKLRARDRDDLVVLSAQLQDAIVAVMDMAYLKDESLFAMVVNRFRWDAGRIEDLAGFGSDEDDEAQNGDGGETGYFLRTHAAVRFSGVQSVASKNIDTGNRSTFWNVLAVSADIDEATGEYEILIAFSGGAWTRLKAETLEVLLEDLGEPWPTSRIPKHDAAEAALDEEGSSRTAAPHPKA